MKKIITVVTLGILILTGCSSTSSGETASETFTNIDDLGREVTYTTEKIYADNYQGQLMYLDANLIGADLTRSSDTWPQEKVDKIIDTHGDMEAVAALEPTLIITLHDDMIDQYEAIAPTFYIEYGKDNPIELVIRLANLLGLESKAETIEDSFNSRVEAIKQTIDQPDLTYTIVDSNGDSIYLMGDNWARGGFILYEYLGMSGSPLGEETYIHNDPTYLLTDEEGFLNYDADVLILCSADHDNSLVKTSSVYNTLTAVENGNVFEMDASYGIYDDPYAIEAQLDFFEEMFSGEL